MRIIKLDFETFYDSKAGYTLKKMTTEEYIRDPRFEVIMVTIKIDNGRTYAIVGEQAVYDHLIGLDLSRKDTVVTAHNARFDASVIEWHYKIRINMVLCTIYMMRETGIARLGGESLDALAKYLIDHGYDLPRKGHTVKEMDGKHLSDMTSWELQNYIQYGITDTDILSAAFDIMVPFCSADALQAMNMTLQMYTRPVLSLNVEMLEGYLERLQLQREQMLANMALEYNYPSVDKFLEALRSKESFATLLRRLGVEPPMKLSIKRSERLGVEVYDYAFAKADLAFQALREHPNPKVVAIVEARLANNSSIAESRTMTFIGIGRRGALPIPYEYAGAHTGRYSAGNKSEDMSGDKTNLQNLPKRGGDKTLRTAIRAPEGYEIGAADSSQIEARLLAYAAQQQDLLEVFAKGGDPYSVMAGRIYGVNSEDIYHWTKGLGADCGDEGSQKMIKVHTGYRNVGKETILGSGYQMSGAKFALRLKQQGIILHPSDEQRAAMRATYEWNREAGSLEENMEQWEINFHEEEAKRINRIYRQTNPMIVKFWSVCAKVLDWMIAGKNGYFGGPDGTLFYFDGNHQVFGERVPGIMLPDGYWLLYPELRSYVDHESGYMKYTYKRKLGRKLVEAYIYGGALAENLTQALAFAVLKWQAVRIHRELPVRMNTHDEWGAIYQPQYREQVRALFTKWMTATPEWCAGVPLDCEFKCGLNYGEC